MVEPLVFDSIALIEVPVKIANSKGELEDYVLREADGEAEIKFNNARLKGTIFGDNGKPKTVGDVNNVKSLLVSLCLYKVSNGARVHEAEIRSWPSRIQDQLFDTAKKISRIDQPETVEELEKAIADLTKQLEKLKADGDPSKNSPSDTTDGSD